VPTVQRDTRRSWNPGTVVVSCRQFRGTLGAVGTLELWWYRADSSEGHTAQLEPWNCGGIVPTVQRDTRRSWNPGTVVVSCRQFRGTHGAVGTLEQWWYRADSSEGHTAQLEPWNCSLWRTTLLIAHSIRRISGL
jgi:hypothetical protein